MICKTCEEQVSLVNTTPGSIWVEIVLWMLFCAPGLVYSVWRLSKRRLVCSQCMGSDLVHESSAAGRRITRNGQSSSTSAEALAAYHARSVARAAAAKDDAP